MFNKYTAIGYLVADAELRYTGSGTAIADFKIASNYKYKDTEEVIFMPCTIFGKFAESISPYLLKGSLVFIEGRLKEESWEKDGQKRSVLKTMVENLKLLGSKGGVAGENKKMPKAKSALEAF